MGVKFVLKLKKKKTFFFFTFLFFFFTFLNREKQTWNWDKIWLFLLVEKGRKSPLRKELNSFKRIHCEHIASHRIANRKDVKRLRVMATMYNMVTCPW